MSPPQQSDAEQRPTKAQQPRQRRTFSCLPCRLHKLRCDRKSPCQSCVRHSRQDRCRLNPPPSTILVRPKTVQRIEQMPVTTNIETSESSGMDLPPTPLSSATQESTDAFASYTTTNGSALTDGNSSLPTNLRVPQVTLSVASTNFSPAGNRFSNDMLDNPVAYWKQHLINNLPSQTQCDLLVSYFFENANWMYNAIHVPTFRSEYARFWISNVDTIDLTWLALLYIILSLSALYMPSQMVEAGGMEVSEILSLSRRWYASSRQAVHANEFDAKSSILQIQVFLVSQIYWYATKNIEALNSCLGQVVRNAQMMGLDKESPPSLTNQLEREMRHRLWWDLVSSDTFQSLCLGRNPLLQSHLSTVPFPSNCNDIDITPSNIIVRPISEPTEMSVHCFRARMFKVLNRLYMNNGANLSSYAFVAGIDNEMMAIMEDYPWYLRSEENSPLIYISPQIKKVLLWILHSLHSCICIQRIRMFRPFIHHDFGDALHRCVAASSSALAVYKSLRNPDIARFRRSQKMHFQAYQVFAAAVTMSTLLLVEMPPNAEPIRSDIELILEDLHACNELVGDSRLIPLISDGEKVIRRILGLYDVRLKRGPKETRNHTRGFASGQPLNAAITLVPQISSVFGGESSARRYLERCATEQSEGSTGSTERSADRATIPADMELFTDPLDLSAWDEFIDLGAWSQLGEDMWTEFDSTIAMGLEIR